MRGSFGKKLFLSSCLAISVIAIAFIVNNTIRDWLRSKPIYWALADKVATPLMHTIESETAHATSIKMLKNNFGPISSVNDPKILHTNVWGLEFSNPLGIASGYDKHAEAIAALLQMGFGFIEVGGVTPQPQAGNSKPRVFRLKEDKAVINRYGLNSDGQDIISARLAKFNSQNKTKGIVGINIAKNTTSSSILSDYREGIRRLGNDVNFIVLNVSCPNVTWAKDLENNHEELLNMVCAVKQERESLNNPNIPILMKLGPDMNDATKAHMAKIALDCNVDGLIMSNTSTVRSLDLKSVHSNEMGGLSGKPIKVMALQSLRDMYRLTNGTIPIIGVGGIESGKDAYERIRAGASLVQIYTALIYQGPSVVPKIKHELSELLKRDGFASIADAVGVDTPVN